MRIDHVIYAAQDLPAATARLADEIGIAPTGGGRHVGFGTYNEIIPLGASYLEVLAVADADEARDSPFGSALQERLAAAGDGLWGWAVMVDAIEPVAERLGTPILVVERDGLRAQITGVIESLAAGGSLPFFIARDRGVADPGAASGPGIAWLEIAGDEAELTEWLGGATLGVRVVPGTDGVRAIGLGERELRSR